MAKKWIEFDEYGNKWEVRESFYKHDSRGKAHLFDGSDWRLVEYFVPIGHPYRSHRVVTKRSDLNKQRAKPIVSRSLRHHLEKMEYFGIINGTGKLLLEMERNRGGKQPKVPIWWIYEESEKLRKSNKYNQHGLALKLTDMASEIWGLGENKEITTHDIKNARRAINQR